ncbi:MAG: FHA domain-containing protein [Candidatus Eremiobacteraeota bacterium]|nr:FHA domain-containing protein [Candidatus Eremiobacteraeota bacterium]
MNPLATLRIGSLEIVGALALFAAVAAVPRTRAVRDAGTFAPAKVALDILEHGASRRFEGLCPLTIGRSSAADVMVMDGEVSRAHARLESQSGIVYASDAGSSNGTFLNGRRLDGAIELRPGDRIDVGATRITFVGSGTWA